VRGALAACAMTLALLGRLPRLPAPAAAHPSPPAAPAPTGHEPPIPVLPSVSRVRIETARDRTLVIEEINLPRGEWRSGGLDVYVAFGSPGPPIAVDARLLTLPPGDSEASLEDAGDPVVVQAGPRASPAVQVILGRRPMAGVTLRVKESQLRSAYASSDLAVLRVRTLLHPPAADDEGARDVVVRLGVSAGLPITLARIQVVSLEKAPSLSRARAWLCGPEADPWPLSVGLVPKPAPKREGGRAEAVATITPTLALRHASDDLCVRWWTVP
jgi:hypothetical protein